MKASQSAQPAANSSSAGAAIVIQRLNVKFGNRHILKDIELEVPRGKTMAIMGLSGVGKSTLIKSIMGLVRPSSGQIWIRLFGGSRNEEVPKAKDVLQLSEAELNKVRVKIGMVFQSPALFDSMSIADNVAFPLREHTHLAEEEIQRVVSETLALVDLEGMDHLYPNQLSGGMQKRASIARAVCTGAEIILYDEPTTGLDPIISNVINQLIKSLQKQLLVTSVVITHDLQSAYQVADEIAFLYNGEIVEQGSPEEFQKSENPYVVQFREGSVHGPIRV